MKFVNVSEDIDDVSLEWESSPDHAEPGNVAIPSPCTVVISGLTLQTNDTPMFEFHYRECTRVFLKFGMMSGLVNHDLTKHGWTGDHGNVFDPQGVLAATFQTIFMVFEHLLFETKLTEIHEQACVCACLTLAMKFTRRSAMWAVPNYALDCDPRRVKLGHVFSIIYERGVYNEESMHTLIENWEGVLLRSSLNLFWCCVHNAAALAELTLYERFRTDPDTKRVTVLRDVASFLFLGLHVGGLQLVEMTKCINQNIVLARALATAAIAIEDFSRYRLDEPEAALAVRVIDEVLQSPQCGNLMTQAQKADTIGFLFGPVNMRRAIRVLEHG